MDNDRLLELLSKKSAGELTLQEQIELNHLVHANAGDQSFAAIVEDLMSTSTTYQESITEREVDDFIQRVHYKIDKKSGESRVIKFNWRALSAAAAVLLIIVMGVTYYLSKNTVGTNSPNVVATKKGNKTNIVLPDGSKVWVNADSRLTYDQSFGKDTREVTLTGEAYFDVVHDKEHPFIVHTKNIDIRVLGTMFNVRSYADEISTQTTLVKGSVQVSLKNEKQKKIMLAPNEKLVVQNAYSQQEQVRNSPDLPQIELLTIKPSPVDSSVAETQWINNKLAFENEHLENLVPTLERWYNVKIILRNKTITQTFSGAFENDALEDVLQSLQLSARIKYKIEKDTVTIY